MNRIDWFGVCIGLFTGKNFRPRLSSENVTCADSNDLGTTVSGYSHTAGGLGGIGHPGMGIDGNDYQGIGPNLF